MARSPRSAEWQTIERRLAEQALHLYSNTLPDPGDHSSDSASADYYDVLREAEVIRRGKVRIELDLHSLPRSRTSHGNTLNNSYDSSPRRSHAASLHRASSTKQRPGSVQESSRFDEDLEASARYRVVLDDLYGPTKETFQHASTQSPRRARTVRFEPPAESSFSPQHERSTARSWAAPRSMRSEMQIPERISMYQDRGRTTDLTRQRDSQFDSFAVQGQLSRTERQLRRALDNIDRARTHSRSPEPLRSRPAGAYRCPFCSLVVDVLEGSRHAAICTGRSDTCKCCGGLVLHDQLQQHEMRCYAARAAFLRMKTIAPYIGIVVLARETNRLHGVRITEVHRRSPAEAAGLRVGDLVTKIGAEAVKGNRDQFDRVVLRQCSPGEKVTFRVHRGGVVDRDFPEGHPFTLVPVARGLSMDEYFSIAELASEWRPVNP